MRKDGPLNQTPLAQAIQETEVRDPAPKPFIPPQSDWPAEPPLQQQIKANQTLMQRFRALDRSK